MSDDPPKVGGGAESREMTIRLGGRHITLLANYGAAEACTKEIGDPLFIAREFMLDEHALKTGRIGHVPLFQFTAENIPRMLHIGTKAAGSAMTLGELQALAFRDGFYASRYQAIRYLNLLVQPAPVSPVAVADLTTLATAPGLH